MCRTSQSDFLRPYSSSKFKPPATHFTFGPSVRSMNLLCPLLTSTDPSHRLTTAVAQGQIGRSPRVMRTHLHAYACRIYFHAPPYRYWTLKKLAFSSRHGCLVCGFCSSGQRFACGFLQIPPRGGHPCRPANSSPCRACRGLSPPSECALPGAPIKKASSC
jgi:hypothetical protein